MRTSLCTASRTGQGHESTTLNYYGAISVPQIAQYKAETHILALSLQINITPTHRGTRYKMCKSLRIDREAFILKLSRNP